MSAARSPARSSACSTNEFHAKNSVVTIVRIRRRLWRCIPGWLGTQARCSTQPTGDLRWPLSLESIRGASPLHIRKSRYASRSLKLLNKFRRRCGSYKWRQERVTNHGVPFFVEITPVLAVFIGLVVLIKLIEPAKSNENRAHGAFGLRKGTFRAGQHHGYAIEVIDHHLIGKKFTVEEPKRKILGEDFGKTDGDVDVARRAKKLLNGSRNSCDRALLRARDVNPELFRSHSEI